MSDKVRARNGKLYTRDHPHEIISPNIMRFAEIRDAMRELLKPEYGWNQAALDRALGFTSQGEISRILRAGWIWPKQQMRLTIRIRQIREGYIVPRMVGRRLDGVYVDPPIPPKVSTERCLKLRATLKGLEFVAQDYRPPPKLPSFARAFAEALPWNPKK